MQKHCSKISLPFIREGTKANASFYYLSLLVYAGVIISEEVMTFFINRSETAMTNGAKNIADNTVAFLPLFARLDGMLEKGRVILAVEGGSASGKTTLGGILGELYGCTVFHTDDFFLRPEQRTPERYAEPGGNIDRERFLEEVLVPLSRNEAVHYRRFDCSTLTLSSAVEILPGRLTVIEGAYSMHPSFSQYYDLSVFLNISPELQRKRILLRNSPRQAEMFFNKWIPLEREYFSKLQVQKSCSMTFDIRE